MALVDVVAAASETSGSLKKLIKLKLKEQRTVSWLKPDSYLRVSALSTMCAREEVLATLNRAERTDKIEADLKLIFAHGKGLHYILQNEVLADIGALVGIWKCVECAKQFGSLDGELAASTTLVHKPSRCDSCSSEEFLYREQHFIDHKLRIGGHPDGFLELEGFPGLGIVECKSIATHRAWEVKHTPDIGHVIQAQSYMWLTGLQWAKILYWDKGGQGASALLEHTVERDEETIEKIKEMIVSIWKGIEANTLPDRICDTAECPRAKKCQLSDLCFEE